jgi:hypothetical protein
MAVSARESRNDETFNGWANWTTWNVALWLGNDEPLYWAMVAEANRLAHRVTAAQARRFASAWMGSVTRDGAQLRFCRWAEIAAMMNEAGDA